MLPVQLPDGSLIAGTNTLGNGAPSVLRSTDGGETWAVYGEYAGLYPYAFAVLPPDTEHTETRLVAADALGLVYSADGGLTCGHRGGRWNNGLRCRRPTPSRAGSATADKRDVY